MFKIIFFLLVILFLFYIGNHYLSKYSIQTTQHQKSSIISENFQDYNNLLFFFDINQKLKLNFFDLNLKVMNYQQLKDSHNSELKISYQISFFNHQFIKIFNKLQNILKLQKIDNNQNLNNELIIVQEDNILYDKYFKRKINSFKSSIDVSSLWFINSMNKLYFFFITIIPQISHISYIKKYSKIGVVNSYDLIRLQRINNILDINFNIIKYNDKTDMLNDLTKKNIKFIFITLPIYDIEKLLNTYPEFLLISIDKKYHSIINYIFKVILFDQKKIHTQKELITLNTCYLKEILVIKNIKNYNKIYLFLILLVKNLKKINYFTQFKFIDILNEDYLSFCSPFFQYHPSAKKFWINKGKIIIY